ncbi:hypothetical protein [Mesorhizobium kowhaii]|uniref:hypothetical protein n=1 Tax=Mesorhizobium kowhaii TaxID=1300272 RepID=UPI0011B60EAC|nr:hypothetical protein [Mesorhizobium kowhaii]
MERPLLADTVEKVRAAVARGTFVERRSAETAKFNPDSMQCAGVELDSNIGGDFAVRRTFSTVSAQNRCWVSGSGRNRLSANVAPDPEATFIVHIANGSNAPHVGRRDNFCRFLEVDIAGDQAEGRGCATRARPVIDESIVM